MSTKAIGIDLGTTYSCVGVWKDERVDIVTNDQGNRTTPSCVAFTDMGRMVGDAAMNQVAMNPRNTVFDVKRLMGRQFHGADVQADMKQWPFKVVERDDRPVIEVEMRGERLQFAPEEISAMVLRKMRESAERSLGGGDGESAVVQDAVITVPAYFNDAQRQATKDAGTIAGLNVLRIINEPTAAALAYGLDKHAGEEHVLIFDLGGGTFDVSLLTLAGGIVEVRATAGNTHLGGTDLDGRMVDYFAQEFKRKFDKDLMDDARAVRRLRTACERAKRTLSARTNASLQIDSLLDGIDFHTSITRARFEELCIDLFRQTLEPVHRVLCDAHMDKADIDEVVLVGGSTRIPKIQKMVSDMFAGRQLNRSIHPDEAVAHGAAVQAAILTGDTSDRISRMVLLDVAPLSLGIETVGGLMTTLIKRNTTVPARKSELFTTCATGQDSVLIQVYEGERARTCDNHLLGQFVLDGIALAPRGVPRLEVTFDIDANGILHISAMDECSGRCKRAIVACNKSRLPSAEIERMVATARRYETEDHAAIACIHARNELEGFAHAVRDRMHLSLILGPVYASAVHSAEWDRASHAIDETILWLETTHDNDAAVTRQEFKERHRQLMDAVKPVLRAMDTLAR